MTLELREITFIRNQLLVEDPKLPKLISDISLTDVIIKLVDFAINKSIAQMDHDPLADRIFSEQVNKNNFRELMDKGRIREKPRPLTFAKYELGYTALDYFPSYQKTLNKETRINFVDWAYKAVVIEIMNFRKAILMPNSDTA